jgi:putative endonuclease
MKTNKIYSVYILTNYTKTVLYVGVTSDLSKRLLQHKTKYYAGFTSKYNVNKLVYLENFAFVQTAIEREKQIKKYRREKKNILISSFNPNWEEIII